MVVDNDWLRAALEALGGARQVMPGAWIGECPVGRHERPSLTWAYRTDGSVLIACQDGCALESVLAQLAPPPEQAAGSDAARAGQPVSSDVSATVQPSAIARAPSILDAVADVVARMGVAGERRVVKLLYLALTTRLLERPVSIAVKGPSAAGKSYLVGCVLRLFPPSAYDALSAMSERALIYDNAPLAHRFLVIFEAAGMAGDLQTYIIRSLLSEGRLRYKTVERTKSGLSVGDHGEIPRSDQ